MRWNRAEHSCAGGRANGRTTFDRSFNPSGYCATIRSRYFGADTCHDSTADRCASCRQREACASDRYSADTADIETVAAASTGPQACGRNTGR
jgi:hypothetical protein